MSQQFFPSLNTMPLIDSAIQQARGAAAAVLGQTYNIFRNPTLQTGLPSPSVNNAVMSGVPLIANYPARLRRTTAKVAIENEIFGLLCFEATADNRSLDIQDVVQEVPGSYETDGGVFTVAQRRPTREFLWMRTESNCAITRPFPKGGAASQMPVSGAVASPGYGGIPKSNEQVLTLTNGFYNFSASGATQASVQCGLQALRKIKDGNTLEAPTALPRTEFLIYIPDLPGEMLNTLDRINFPNQDRYEINQLFSSSLTGLTGYICVVEKLGV